MADLDHTSTGHLPFNWMSPQVGPCTATRRALAQTVENIEVVVVIDGPDDETRAALATVTDPRVRVVARLA